MIAARAPDTQRSVATAMAALRALDDPGRAVRVMVMTPAIAPILHDHLQRDPLPDWLILAQGPACPLSALAPGRIDQAIAFARLASVRLHAPLAVGGLGGSAAMTLARAHKAGVALDWVASAAETLAAAAAAPQTAFIWMATGFEDAALDTAAVLRDARRLALNNFCVFCNHLLRPAALSGLVNVPEPVDGFVFERTALAAAGAAPYRAAAILYRRPIVFGPATGAGLLAAVRRAIALIIQDRHDVAVLGAPVDPPPSADAATDVFEATKYVDWRGLGTLPYGALRLRREFLNWDAEHRYPLDLAPRPTDGDPAMCTKVLRGANGALACPDFGLQCHPDHPRGICMAAPQGACRSAYLAANPPANAASVEIGA